MAKIDPVPGFLARSRGNDFPTNGHGDTQIEDDVREAMAQMPGLPHSSGDPYAPKHTIRNLRELEREIAGGPPLFHVAASISDLKFHDLMTIAQAIVGTAGFKADQPYELAAALSSWALKERAEAA